MAWPKGQPRGPKKKPEGEQSAPPEPTPEKKPEQISSPRYGQMFQFDTAIYHNEHEPRDLKAGEPLPEGWTNNPSKLKVKWQNNRDGSWFKIPVEE